MSIRTTVTAFALALATVTVTPAPAMAGRGCDHHRSVTGKVWGAAFVNTATLALGADVNVRLSHIGRGTAHFEAQGELTPDGTRATGAFSMVAANGDEVTGTFRLAGPAPSPNVHVAELELTITGGTGRFSGATGTLRSVPTLTPILPIVPPTIHETVDGTVSGHIRY